MYIYIYIHTYIYVYTQVEALVERCRDMVVIESSQTVNPMNANTIIFVCREVTVITWLSGLHSDRLTRHRDDVAVAMVELTTRLCVSVGVHTHN